MAWRAGCRISNMEFMQFHPTCLYNLQVKNFLITEAVRGEGGQLKLPPGVKGGGKRFMPQFDARGELAPRDIVARAIDHEIKRLGLDYVHLDISHREPEFVREHFPNIYEKLLGLGIDITKEPIPVVPAQHYTCGGVVVDLDGRTDAPGLYAAGEVTQSGLHGANRLASNSLLECLVFGEAAAKHIAANWDELPDVPDIRAWDESRVTDSDEEVVIAQTWGEIRRFMWNYVGIVRTTKRLERAKHRIDMLRQEVRDYYAHFRVTPDLIELRNLVEVADLIIRSALVAARKPRPALHARLSRHAAGGEGHGAGAVGDDEGGQTMPVELKILALGALLLFIHIFIATRFKTAQYGRKWNVGARDEALPEPNPVTGRTMRAQANFQETFPIAIVALLGVGDRRHGPSQWTALGGWIWLGARASTCRFSGLGDPGRADGRLDDQRWSGSRW